MLRDNFDDLNHCERVTMKWILKNKCVMVWTGFRCSEYGALMGFCEHGSERSCFIKIWEFLDWDVSFSKRTVLHGVS
jgi:hypothetical protein